LIDERKEQHQVNQIRRKKKYMTKDCIRSGYCCKQAICPFGKWDKEKKACAYLEGDRPGSYSCSKYSEIIQHPDADFSPAFGAGCCSSLNSDRQNLLKKQRSSKAFN
jgi:hypothetical protein